MGKENNDLNESPDNDNIGEEEEEEIKLNIKESEMIKEKVRNYGKNQVKTIDKQRQKIKLYKGIYYKEKLNNSKKLANELRKDNEHVSVEHDKLNRKRV